MRILMFCLALLVFSLTHAVTVEASGYCPSQKNGKCPAKKVIKKSRSDFTEAQREKLMENAREICRKKYGATSRVHKIEYSKWTVVCTQPGW